MPNSDKKTIVPVILAGGSGSRLWPLSRELFPKQLINLTCNKNITDKNITGKNITGKNITGKKYSFGKKQEINENTMLQDTLLRLKDFDGICDPIVLCNENHRFMVAEQLRLINVKPASIILEPVGKNTAPALAVAAIKAVSNGEDPILLVLPADHIILDVSVFHAALERGFKFSMENYLVTFGIVPSSPEVGYGYIKKGESVSLNKNNDKTFIKTEENKQVKNKEVEIDINTVTLDKFVEKPDFETAVKYVKSGQYCWNSGMFMFKASNVLTEFNKHVPDIVSICEKSVEKGEGDLDFFRLDKPSFVTCPDISIDYAIMEKTQIAVMVELQAEWSDLGSFEALWQIGEKNSDGNVIKGDILVHDVKNSFLHANHRLIAAVGLENHIVIETSDAVMISPRNRVQEVKRLVEKLKMENREEAVIHRKVYRPWGSYEGIDKSDRFQVKRITVNPGGILSLQKHFHRAEHWVVVGGSAIVTTGEEKKLLKEDESIYIPLGTVHRLENPGKIPLDIIEVQSGSYLGEDDIVRMEDVYGR